MQLQQATSIEHNKLRTNHRCRHLNVSKIIESFSELIPIQRMISIDNNNNN